MTESPISVIAENAIAEVQTSASYGSKYCYNCGTALSLSTPLRMVSEDTVFCRAVCACDQCGLKTESLAPIVLIADFTDAKSHITHLLHKAIDNFFWKFDSRSPLGRDFPIHVNIADGRLWIEVHSAFGEVCGAAWHYFFGSKKELPCWFCGKPSYALSSRGCIIDPLSCKPHSISHDCLVTYLMCDHCGCAVRTDVFDSQDDAEYALLHEHGLSLVRQLVCTARLSDMSMPEVLRGNYALALDSTWEVRPSISC